MKTTSLTCQIAGRFRISTDDQPLERDAAVVELWRQLAEQEVGMTYTHDGHEITVLPNWAPLKAHLEKQYRITERFQADPNSVTVQEWGLFSKRITIPVRIEVTGGDKYVRAFPIAEAYIYDLFLIANLALPGAADFLGVRVDSPEVSKQPDIRLGSYYLEVAATDREGKWPRLRTIDIETVAKWYSRVRHNLAQLPDSPVERAMFALLHVCKSDGVPEDIIWLFYAFESLFQTRVGENFASIVERIGLLLEPDPKQEKHMRKQLRAMYDYRSKFVHGGLAVIHPMHHEGLDKRVDDEYGTTIDLSIYGVKLLLACLQELVERDWRALMFKVSLEPTISDVEKFRP